MAGVSRIVSFLLCASFGIALTSCGGEKDFATLIEELKSESLETRRSAIFELHRRGKESIPRLIDEISDDRKVSLFLHNPTSSYIHPGSMVNFSGVLSAYVIELILARDKLYRDEHSNPHFILGAGKNELHNYIYANGIIVRKDGDSLGYFDMITVRRIYEQWWHDHSRETLNQLRDDWSNYDTPLAGSIYSWY